MKLILTQAIQEHTHTFGVRHEIDDIFAITLLAQKIYGLQILDPKWSWRNNALKYMCMLILLIYVTIGTIEFIQMNDDIILLTEAVFTIIITVQYLIKTFGFIYYRSNFREVYADAKTTLLDIIKDISPQRSARVISEVRKMIKAQFVLVILPVLNYLAVALWNYFNGTRIPLSKTTSTLMPMTSPYYELGLVLHLNFLLMAAFGLLVVDLWFIFLTHLLCEACDAAVEMLQVKRFHEQYDNTYATCLNEALWKFHLVHVKLMGYLNNLNKMYKWPILIPLCAVLACTCNFLLVISENPNVQLATVMLPASAELFAYNLLGEKIKTKANDLNMALINFDWTGLKLKDKKNYCIIACYMNKPFGITSPIGVDLSLLTLSSVYKGSYQTFAVFNTMKNN